MVVHAERNLHPLQDNRPLRLDMPERQVEVTADVPGRGEPVSVQLRPDKGVWDCSSKLWILADIRNRGDAPLLVRAEVLADSNRKWERNRGGTVVPAGEKGTLPVLIIRGAAGEELQGIFRDMRGYPGGYQYSSWRKLDASNIKRIKLEFFTDAAQVDCEISNLRAAVDFELPTVEKIKADYRPATDEFGQNRNSEWKTKIRAEEDLQRVLKAETAALERTPPLEDRGRYGGWTGGKQHEATGHFRTVQSDGTWWLADPDGWPFWSIGATGFNLKLGRTVTPGIGPWNPQQKNLQRKYGAGWEDEYADFTHRRLKAWGLNTLGNWSSPDFYLMERTPYTVAVHFKRPSLAEPDAKAHSSLPDVFHPDFRKNVFEAVARFEKEAADPWCIGYFIDNELPFHQPNSPAYKTLLSPASCASRQEFVLRLMEKYDGIEMLNAAWNTNYENWDSLAVPDGRAAPAYQADLIEFSESWFHKYYETCREAMREHAPDKLYLGSRINHWKNHTALSICARYADVVSINLYDYTPNVFRAPEGFNAPVMIGEFHFGTITERGVWGGGLCTAMDIGQAASLFQNYVLDALQNPLMVGAHWFKFSDQPLTGRGDGENYRIGFIDVTDTPYPEMMHAGRHVAEMMYGVRSEGTREP
jgi:hypothetical protein